VLRRWSLDRLARTGSYAPGQDCAACRMVCRDYEVRPGTHQTGEPTFILRSAAAMFFAHFINAQADGYPRIIRDANMKVERSSEIDNAKRVRKAK